MDDFSTIRLKKKTLDKFKEYSKKTSPSYSETLEFMIAFFEDNHLSPYDTLNLSNARLLNLVNKRMDAVVSIFRDIEKTQLKPTREMLEYLFRGINYEKPLITEKNTKVENIDVQKSYELKYYKNLYSRQQSQLGEMNKHLSNILKNLKFEKNIFGANQYVLKLTPKDYEVLKSSLHNQ